MAVATTGGVVRHIMTLKADTALKIPGGRPLSIGR